MEPNKKDEFIIKSERPFSYEIENFRELSVALCNEENKDLYKKHAEKYAAKTDNLDVKKLIHDYSNEMQKGGIMRTDAKTTVKFLTELYVKGNIRLTGDEKVSRDLVSVKETKKQIQMEGVLLSKGDKFYGTYFANRELRIMEKQYNKVLKQNYELKQKNEALDRQLKTETNRYNNLVDQSQVRGEKITPDEKSKSNQKEKKQPVEISRAYDIQRLRVELSDSDLKEDLKNITAIGITNKNKLLEGIRNPDNGRVKWITPSAECQKVLDKHIIGKNGNNVVLKINKLETANKIAIERKQIDKMLKEAKVKESNHEITRKEFAEILKQGKKDLGVIMQKYRPSKKESQTIKM